MLQSIRRERERSPWFIRTTQPAAGGGFHMERRELHDAGGETHLGGCWPDKG